MDNVPSSEVVRQEARKLFDDILDPFNPLDSEQLEPYVKLAYLGQAMRRAHLAFFTSPKGSERRSQACQNSKVLEKQFDAVLGLLALPPIEDRQETMPL